MYGILGVVQVVENVVRGGGGGFKVRVEAGVDAAFIMALFIVHRESIYCRPMTDIRPSSSSATSAYAANTGGGVPFAAACGGGGGGNHGHGGGCGGHGGGCGGSGGCGGGG